MPESHPIPVKSDPRPLTPGLLIRLFGLGLLGGLLVLAFTSNFPWTARFVGALQGGATVSIVWFMIEKNDDLPKLVWNAYEKHGRLIAIVALFLIALLVACTPVHVECGEGGQLWSSERRHDCVRGQSVKLRAFVFRSVKVTASGGREAERTTLPFQLNVVRYPEDSQAQNELVMLPSSQLFTVLGGQLEGASVKVAGTDYPLEPRGIRFGADQLSHTAWKELQARGATSEPRWVPWSRELKNEQMIKAQIMDYGKPCGEPMTIAVSNGVTIWEIPSSCFEQ